MDVFNATYDRMMDAPEPGDHAPRDMDDQDWDEFLEETRDQDDQDWLDLELVEEDLDNWYDDYLLGDFPPTYSPLDLQGDEDQLDND